jgi:hypothetical protein
MQAWNLNNIDSVPPVNAIAVNFNDEHGTARAMTFDLLSRGGATLSDIAVRLVVLPH